MKQKIKMTLPKAILSILVISIGHKMHTQGFTTFGDTSWATYDPRAYPELNKFESFDMVLIPHERIVPRPELELSRSKPKILYRNGTFDDWNVLFCDRLKTIPTSGKWKVDDHGSLEVQIKTVGSNSEFKRGETIHYQTQKINDTLIIANRYEHAKAPKIKEIHFRTSGCEGTCPMMELKVLEPPNARSTLHAFAFNLKLKGHYSGIITSSEFDKITNLINGLNLDMYNFYTTEVSCQERYLLEITFTDSRRILVSDYGHSSGSEGLEKLYQTLLDLRFSQSWNKKE
ncbi:DUF6438 domain-containing protein [uncultured Winogradskyella sp.]|uniref:DUF6438 domain-containing protein n=1 Tax=uncultured Winogradskyella sp. TaxID=395353 RepID=UPI002632B69E|nr:DUF6438 domain-containing protein [uncultured Winogradskyella sp.]